MSRRRSGSKSPTELMGTATLLRDDLERILETLREREAGVIRLRFGLTDDGVPRTVREIAEIYRITQKEVREIEARAMFWLRNPRSSRPVRDYLSDEIRRLPRS